MRLPDRLVGYVPAWPSYRAQRLEHAELIAPSGRRFDLAAHGMAAYRVQAFVGGELLAMIIPVPEGLEEPLADPFVMAAIADAVSLA